MDSDINANLPDHDVPSDDAPSDDAPSDDAPSDDAPSDDAPSDDAPSDDVPLITLGSLFKQDMKTANILSIYPTSYAVQNYPFLNDTKYLMHDIPEAGQKKNSSFLYLYAGRISSIAGNEFPILIDKQPSENLMAHWKELLPQFPEPVFKTIKEGLEDEDPVIALFPMQIIIIIIIYKFI
jgi:hypothetical protein